MKIIINLIIILIILNSFFTTSDGAKTLVSAGPSFLLYNSSYGSADPSCTWYINDHTFVFGPNGAWHLIGITHTDPADPSQEVNLAHAVSGLSANTSGVFADPSLWLGAKQPFALGAVNPPETFLWAPYVLYRPEDGLYYMFYCGGGYDRSAYQIRLALSRDLYTWQRKGTLFTGGVDGRDPMVLDLGPKGSPAHPDLPFRYIIYYCGTSPDNPAINNVSHVTYFRTSDDLLSWSPLEGLAFEGGYDGNNFGGPTESPFVVRRNNNYYLFSGAWDGSYTQTRVFYSSDPRNFGSVPQGTATQVGAVTSHAPEVIRDLNGDWWLSSAGWGAGGVFLAPLTWQDGIGENCTTNLGVPGGRFASEPAFGTNLEGPFVMSTATPPAQFVETGSGLMGSNPLDNAFFISSSHVPPTVDGWNCSVDIMLITFNGNPSSDSTAEWARFGSAAGFVFGVADQKVPLSNVTVLNLFTDNEGGIKLFRFPYQEVQIVSQPIRQDTVYHVELSISKDNMIQVWIDHVLIIHTEIDFSTLGYLGVYVWQASANFQNLFCTF